MNERDLKTQLALLVGAVIQNNKLTRCAAAKHIEIDPGSLGKILKGDLYRISLATLFNCLNKMDTEVEITVLPKKNENAEIRLDVRGM